MAKFLIVSIILWTVMDENQQPLKEEDTDLLVENAGDN